MVFVLDLSLAVAAFVGHFSIAVWLFNRLHAVVWPRPTIKALEMLLVLAAATVLVAFVASWTANGHAPFRVAGNTEPSGHWLWLGYVVVCWVAAILVVPMWLVPKVCEVLPAALSSNHTTLIDVAKRLGYRPVHGAAARMMAGLPGNQLLHIAIQRKKLRLPNLPRELDGLTIAHLSDLHMTGKVGREFYDAVVDETMALAADLTVVTGDILEKKQCLPWIGPTLGRLQSPCGKFFVLGNHEKRLGDVMPLRRALGEAGLVDLGSKSKTLLIRGSEVVLAGTELPWFGTAPEIRQSEVKSQEPGFRILLSHTPDQLPWAKAQGFDLMLAGHNHGGQIRLPYLGALITPSWYGCRYAGGLYYEPPTLLHVSRGLGGIHLIRLNCPPELALLTLTCA